MSSHKQDCLTRVAIEILRITGDKERATKAREKWRRYNTREVVKEVRRLRGISEGEAIW